MHTAITSDARLSSARDLLASPTAGLALATLLWSGNFIVGRALRYAIDPLDLNFWRWLIAVAVLLPFTARALVQQWPVIRRHGVFVAALGLSGLAVPHACIYTALQTTTALNALLLLNLAPLLVALGAYLLFGQRLHRGQWMGLGLAMAGAVTLIASGRIETLLTLELRPGDLWMLPAVVGAAAHMLLLRNTPARLTQAPLLAASALAALVWMLPLVLMKGIPPVPRDPVVIASLGYVGVLASALAFWLWNRGVARIGPVRSAAYMFLMPVYAALLSSNFLDEAVQRHQVAGGALVLAGLWLARPRSASTPVPSVASPRPDTCGPRA